MLFFGELGSPREQLRGGHGKNVRTGGWAHVQQKESSGHGSTVGFMDLLQLRSPALNYLAFVSFLVFLHRMKDISILFC